MNKFLLFMACALATSSATAGVLAKRLQITDHNFASRLYMALSQLQDPAVTLAPDTATLSADGQTVTCENGEKTVDGAKEFFADCIFDLMVTGTPTLEGHFAQLLYQGLKQYTAIKPNDELFFTNSQVSGATVRLSSTTPFTPSLVGASPIQTLECSEIRPAGVAPIYSCDFFGLYEKLNPAESDALFKVLSADATYAKLISASSALAIGAGYVLQGTVAWKNLSDNVKVTVTYLKPAPAHRLRSAQYLVVDADQVANQKYVINSVTLGR